MTRPQLWVQRSDDVQKLLNDYIRYPVRLGEHKGHTHGVKIRAYRGAYQLVSIAGITFAEGITIATPDAVHEAFDKICAMNIAYLDRASIKCSLLNVAKDSE